MSISEQHSWVELCTQNIFSIYPETLDNVFSEKPQTLSSNQQNAVSWFVLPSDIEWKTKKYYQLVEKQRQLSAGEQM